MNIITGIAKLSQEVVTAKNNLQIEKFNVNNFIPFFLFHVSAE